MDPARLGAVRPLAYAWALLVLVLPNLLLVGALLFAVATLTRSTLATYVGAIAIYALYLVTALLVDSPLMAGAAPPTPEGLARAALLDPFGLSAFFEQTRYWTPAERDVRLVVAERTDAAEPPALVGCGRRGARGDVRAVLFSVRRRASEVVGLGS